MLPFRGTLTRETQNWAKRNMIKLSKDNCTVLYLGSSNPMLGTVQQGSNFAEKFLKLLLDKLILSWQWGLSVKMASSILGCKQRNIASRSREVILHLPSVLVRLLVKGC